MYAGVSVEFVHTLTLLVRNAFAQELSAVDGRYPATEAFLSRSSNLNHGQTSVTGWICTSFGITLEHGVPIGSLLAHAHHLHGNRSELARSANAVSTETFPHWICIDPVHLMVDRDSLVLQPRSQLGLSKSESNALFSTLEAHFAAANLRMLQIDNGHWCIGTSLPLNLDTTEIELAEGRNVNDLLPTGEDGATWQRNITEAQMILHDHPVNVARDARGDPVVNSLWLWGGGGLPEVSSPFDRIISEEALLRSLAMLSGTKLIEQSNLHTELSSSTAVQLEGNGHQFAEFSPRSDTEGSDVLAELEAQWIAPAWRLLRSGNLDRFTLIVKLPGLLVEYSCDRRARRRFWKRRRSLSASFATLQAAA